MDLQQLINKITGKQKRDHDKMKEYLGTALDKIEVLMPDNSIIIDKKAQVGRDLVKIRNEFTDAWAIISNYVLKHGSKQDKHAMNVLNEETKDNHINVGMYHSDIRLKVSKESLFKNGGFLGKVVYSKRKLNSLIRNNTKDPRTLTTLANNFKNVADSLHYVISVKERKMKR